MTPDPSTLTPAEVSTLIAALEALSVSEYAAEYELAVPLLRRLKETQR